MIESLVRSNEPLRTALHGWANQLTGCPCKCRKFPFSEERLKNKGIFGALIQLQGEINTYLGTLPVTRHMHPWELALLHGCNPNRQWLPNLRFGIAALGQMAAPAQSAWIIGQMQSHVAALEGLKTTPETAIWNQFQCSFAAAHMSKPDVTSSGPFRTYVDGLYRCLYESAQIRIGPGLSVLPAQESVNVESVPHVPPTRFQAMPVSSPAASGPSPGDGSFESSQMTRNALDAPDRMTCNAHEASPAKGGTRSGSLNLASPAEKPWVGSVTYRESTHTSKESDTQAGVDQLANKDEGNDASSPTCRAVINQTAKSPQCVGPAKSVENVNAKAKPVSRCTAVFSDCGGISFGQKRPPGNSFLGSGPTPSSHGNQFVSSYVSPRNHALPLSQLITKWVQPKSCTPSCLQPRPRRPLPSFLVVSALLARPWEPKVLPLRLGKVLEDL